MAGDWNREFGSLASQIEKKTGVTVECMATDTNTQRAEAGLRKGRPTLDHVPSFYRAEEALLLLCPAIDPAGQAEPVEELAHEHKTGAVGKILRAVTDAQRPAAPCT